MIVFLLLLLDLLYFEAVKADVSIQSCVLFTLML